MRAFDAIVIGAGPAGGSAAYFLAKAGLRVAIVERAEFPRRKVCGEFVSATTFPILDTIGIGDLARGGGGPPVSRVGIFGREAVATAPMPALRTTSGPGRTIRRDRLDVWLVEAARALGAELFQPYKAVELGDEGGEHVLTIESEGAVQRLRAPVVVAAHGSWEPGTLPSQLPKASRSSDLLAFKAYYLGGEFPTDLINLVAFPGGYGGMVHRDEETLGFSVCVRRDLVPFCREQFPAATAGESVLRYAASSSRGVGEALASATLERAPMAAGPLRPGFRTGYANGVFRVGNAAGEAHPAIAEGISIAIQSGLLLANHLVGARGESDRAGLDRIGEEYSRAWRRQFGGRLRAAEWYARACMSPAADRMLSPLLTALPGMLTLAARLSGKSRGLDAAPALGLESIENRFGFQ